MELVNFLLRIGFFRKKWEDEIYAAFSIQAAELTCFLILGRFLLHACSLSRTEQHHDSCATFLGKGGAVGGSFLAHPASLALSSCR